MRRLPALASVLLLGCRAAPAPTPARVPEPPPAREPSAAPKAPLAWAEFSAETFARARREGRFVVMDGSAEWCHWCHVMEATTYHDPAVRAVLDRSFIAVKVDVDARPDLQERYADYGWPATVIFSPEAEEIGKYRGYLAPDAFASILREVVKSGAALEGGADPGKPSGYAVGVPRPAPRTPLGEEHLAWIARATELELEDYWDPAQGGWGRMQKAPLGWNNAWLLGRDPKRAIFALDQQAKLIDPVWGGIYQYSAASDWDQPHFEKLMTFQAPALDNYASAYRLTRDPKQLERARAMQRYIERFLRSPEGGFYTTQDADVNAHDPSRPFVDGHAYYALDERSRLARGVPRVDTNVYGRENGLAIGAYATLFEVTGDAAVRETAERAAAHVLATHRTKSGGITHGPGAAKVLFLSDNAAFGWGLARLWEATHDDRWLREATAIADFLLAELADDAGGGLFGSTKDPDAVGIFAARRVPFEDNVMALRLLARLPADARRRTAVGRILRAIAVPDEIKARGRMLGDWLLALEETRRMRAP